MSQYPTSNQDGEHIAIDVTTSTSQSRDIQLRANRGSLRSSMSQHPEALVWFSLPQSLRLSSSSLPRYLCLSPFSLQMQQKPKVLEDLLHPLIISFALANLQFPTNQ
uniref:Uncharacterized protein n=1 Tax=Gossypium raimondii TaxID=29730 RepID=A0A0D2URT9_GOSRA|nr:hypothetical protein B456_009G220000 [Gossypium raimondii]